MLITFHPLDENGKAITDKFEVLRAHMVIFLSETIQVTLRKNSKKDSNRIYLYHYQIFAITNTK